MKSRIVAENAQSLHTPVMLTEIVSFVPDSPGARVIDATLGDGGHSHALLEFLPEDGQIISLDVDQEAIAFVQQKYQSWLGQRWQIIHSSYVNIKEVVAEQHWPNVHLVLFDVGVSSRHLDHAERGFSFASGAVDMRMDQRLTVSAADLLNVLPVHQLIYILQQYGDYNHKQAENLARAVVRYRHSKPFGSHDDAKRLQSIAKKYAPHRLHHPATVLFQAIRIAVNDEFGNIQQGLEAAWDVLAPTGVLVVLSYHSGEHKLVESFLQKHADRAEIHAQPQYPTATEIAANRRSRSAQLRWLRKKS